MRIRGTKPEFWRSKLIASVPWEARFVLKALESYVDDNGVGEDDVNVLVGDCFLHDLIREPSRTLAKVSEAISQLHQAGLVWRYEGNDRNLLYVSFWETVQRIDKAQAGRNPRPDGTWNYKDSVIRESSRGVATDAGALAPVTGEQGNRGTEEQGNSSLVRVDLEALFTNAWSHWPKKVERKDALAKFKVASKKHDPDQLAAVIAKFGDAYAATTEPQYVPALGVWIGRERWDDTLPQARTVQRAPTRGEENLAFLVELASEESGRRREITDGQD